MNNIFGFVQDNVLTISSIIAGFGAWGYERSKRKIDIKESQTQHDVSIVNLYQNALDDLKNRYDEKFEDLEIEIKILREELKGEKAKNNSLKKAFETYRKNNKNETNK